MEGQEVRPTHVFLQAGVGAMAGGVCAFLLNHYRDCPHAYISCADYVAAHGMRTYAYPAGSDPSIISGESGAVTMGLVRMILEKDGMDEIRSKLKMNRDSVILLFNTEGGTDWDSYEKIVEHRAYPMP